ncbi:MAG: helix-turn-helix domain-containing protein [Pseudonocardia sp.]
MDLLDERAPAPDTQDWATRRPHPALGAMVSRYIGYRQRGVTLPVHRGLPSEHVTLIVSLAEPIRILGMPGSAQGPLCTGAFAGGLHTGPALVGQDEAQAGVHLELNPLGVRTLLGVSAAELAGRVVELSELPRPGLAELPDRLRAARGWSARFALLDEVLLRAARHAREHRPAGEIGWAWRRMRGAGGAVRVTELAADVGWSRRHFSERFTREVGLPPKQAARVVRFGRVTELLRTAPATGLSSAAQACGYFDQAHLTNEFNALAGCTPGTWIAEELPFLQDPGGPGGEHWADDEP